MGRSKVLCIPLILVAGTRRCEGGTFNEVPSQAEIGSRVFRWENNMVWSMALSSRKHLISTV